MGMEARMGAFRGDSGWKCEGQKDSRWMAGRGFWGQNVANSRTKGFLMREPEHGWEGGIRPVK